MQKKLPQHVLADYLVYVFFPTFPPIFSPHSTEIHYGPALQLCVG